MLLPTNAIMQGKKRRDNSLIAIDGGGPIDHILSQS